jgi:hypothetical protein
MRRIDDRALVVTGALIAAAGFLWQSRITADGDYLSAVLGPAYGHAFLIMAVLLLAIAAASLALPPRRDTAEPDATR